MSAVIAVLAVLAVALAAGISTRINQGWPNYPAEQSGNAAQSEETAPDDKPEQKRSHKQADKGSVNTGPKQKEPACVRDCPAPWLRYEVAPWPI